MGLVRIEEGHEFFQLLFGSGPYTEYIIISVSPPDQWLEEMHIVTHCVRESKTRASNTNFTFAFSMKTCLPTAPPYHHPL